MAPVVRAVSRLVGWLLTPLVAWAASFAGASIGASLTSGMKTGASALWITTGLGLLTALVGAWGWLRLVRRSRKLQETLAVAPDGTPMVVVEHIPPEDVP